MLQASSLFRFVLRHALPWECSIDYHTNAYIQRLVFYALLYGGLVLVAISGRYGVLTLAIAVGLFAIEGVGYLPHGAADVDLRIPPIVALAGAARLWWKARRGVLAGTGGVDA